MDGAQVGILEKTDQVGLASFLESHDRAGLEPQVTLEILSNLADQTLERQLAKQQFSGLLVFSDFSECHCSRTITMRFFDSSCSRSRLASSLGSQLFPWGLATSRFTGSLLSTSHILEVFIETRC